MYIQKNKMLPPTSRVIKPYSCSMLATEGPNIMGKLNLSGVEIRYDSQFTSRMVLNPGSTNQPLLYGFLGEYVTFIMLKITYDETNPKCQIEEEQYINYYFQDQPSIKRQASKLLLLTGNSTNRIPQIFLENPSVVKVTVEAMVANLDQPDIIDESNYVTLDNLYYNSIISDQLLSISNNNNTGSTQLQIIDNDDYILLYIDYIDILTIEPRYETTELKITTVSDATIILGFLSLFDLYQAHSRISYVINKPLERCLTKDTPTPDTEGPVITLNSVVEIEPNTYVYPYTGQTILPEDIIEFFIDTIIDNRDGELSKYDANIKIRKQGHLETINQIEEDGLYNILIYITDIANNQSSINYIIVVDDQPPVITFKPIAQGEEGSEFIMTIDDASIPLTGITNDDIILKTVDSVNDNVEGIIPNSRIIMYLNDVSTPLPILSTPGEYDIIYYVEDIYGNFTTNRRTLLFE